MKTDNYLFIFSEKRKNKTLTVLLIIVLLLALLSLIHLPTTLAESDTTNPINLLAETLTATHTVTTTPTVTSTATITPLVTDTATHTVTMTSTVTSTATITPLATDTPTVTGTIPTQTATGTIIPDMAVEKTVSPGEAHVGQLFSFTIQVSNNGAAPAYTSYLTDTLPLVLTITGASTSKGTYTINSTANTVAFTMGTINPSDLVIAQIWAQVNNTATNDATYPNSAMLNYVVSSVVQSKTSNSVSYQVIVSGKLIFLPVVENYKGK